MTDEPNEDDGRGIKFYGIGAIGTLVLIVLSVFLSPLLHDIALGLYANPWLVHITVISGAVAYVVKGKLEQKREEEDSRTSYNQTSIQMHTFQVFCVAFFVLLVSGGLFMGIVSEKAMGQQTMADSEQIDTMYEADADHPRIVTRDQASRWASGSVRSSKYNPTQNSIVVYNNTTHWGSNLVPTSSTANHLTEKQNGTVLVNAESFEKDVTVVRGEMTVGRGMGITDNVEWRLKSVLKGGPWLVNYHLNHQRTIVYNGNQYLAVPYTQPDHHYMTYSHPSEGGVALVASDGSIEHLSLSEARENDVLNGQPLMPPTFVKHKIAATTYRAGIMDTLPIVGGHEETISIAPVPGANNEQPFYMRTAENGGQYVVAVEPTGGTQGLRELWFVDARTGEFARYESSQDSTLYGARKSADFVIDANDKVSWDKFAPSEPIPTVVNDNLYWQFRVVQQNGGGITFVAMVNAESQEVVNIDDDEGVEAVSAFMRGEDVAEVNNDVNGDESEREPTLIVEKRNSEGEVIEEMYVYDDETVVTKPNTNHTSD